MVSHRMRLGAWGVADKSLSSLTNFALSVVVARSVTLPEFGAFTLAFATYGIALGASAAIVSGPLSIRFSDCDVAEWRRGCRLGTGATLLVSILIGAVCVAVGLSLSQPLRGTLIVLGLSMPLLIIQDCWRLAFFASGEPSSSFLLDLIWAACQVPLFVVLMVRGTSSVVPFVVAWGGSAAVAAAVGMLKGRALPDVVHALSWWREQRDLIPGHFGDFIIRNGAQKVGVYTVAAIAGLSATGAIRGMTLLLTPLIVFFQGLDPIKVPDAVRIVNRTPERLWRWSLRLSLAFTGVALAYAVAMLFFPDSLGRILLKDTWNATAGLLFIGAIAYAGNAASNGAMVGVRALGDARRLFKARLFVGPLMTLGTIAGAAVGAAPGAVVGTAIMAWISVAVHWKYFHSAMSERGLPVRSGQTFPQEKTDTVPIDVADTPTAASETSPATRP
jgi:hypothetical protein